MLQKGDRVFEATAKQQGMLSEWSGREPVSQIGTIRHVFPPARMVPWRTLLTYPGAKAVQAAEYLGS